MKLLAASIVLLTTALSAFASAVPAVPEIGGDVAVAALGLVGGALLVLRGRRKK